MKVEITAENDEHPGCLGKDCEGQHFIKTIKVKAGKNVLVYTDRTDEYKLLASMFGRLTPGPIEDATTIMAKSKCTCGEVFYVQRMLTDLEHAVSQCKNHSK